MPKYILVYRGSPRQPSTPEEGAEHMERYMAWMRSLGRALVSPANPVGPSKIVGEDGVQEPRPQEAFNGYSVVEAETMEEALDIARRCPYLAMGSLEVAELKEWTPDL